MPSVSETSSKSVIARRAPEPAAAACALAAEVPAQLADARRPGTVRAEIRGPSRRTRSSSRPGSSSRMLRGLMSACPARGGPCRGSAAARASPRADSAAEHAPRRLVDLDRRGREATCGFAREQRCGSGPKSPFTRQLNSVQPSAVRLPRGEGTARLPASGQRSSSSRPHGRTPVHRRTSCCPLSADGQSRARSRAPANRRDDAGRHRRACASSRDARAGRPAPCTTPCAAW